jgi:hypothetical protein
MKLYTFLTKEEFDTLNTNGYLTCDASRTEPYYKEAYDFMADNLEKKYSKKNIDLEESIVYPRWAWYSWMNNKDILSCEDLIDNFRPDRYLIVCNIPDEQVLLSDYDNWHHCLNYMYLSRTEEEEAEIESMRENIEADKDEMHNLMHKSWLRIFDPEFPNQWIIEKDCHSLQAVFWVLYKSQVEEWYSL